MVIRKIMVWAVTALLVGTPVDSAFDGRTDLGSWHYGHMFGFAGDSGQWVAGHTGVASHMAHHAHPMTHPSHHG